MTINTFSTLKTAVGNWLERDDLGDRIDEFILLGENRIYRRLRVRQMEAALSDTISASGTLALPSNYLELRHAYIDGTPTQWLDVKEPQWIHQMFPTRSGSAKPENIARDASVFIFGPYPDSQYTVKGTYYQKLTALSTSNESNFLVTDMPELILFASLVEAAAFVPLPMERVLGWEAKYTQAYDDVTEQHDQERFPRDMSLRVTTG